MATPRAGGEQRTGSVPIVDFVRALYGEDRVGAGVRLDMVFRAVPSRAAGPLRARRSSVLAKNTMARAMVFFLQVRSAHTATISAAL